jgi:LmbE family N-acetylglucosaminyl deacetylase
MLLRSTLGENRAERGITALFPETAAEASVLFIVAHPGDEIIAAGGSLHDIPNASFLHVTNGAPRDLATAFNEGFIDRREYAEARKREFFAALRCAGLKEEQVSELGFVAGEVSRNLATLTMSIAAVLREQQPDVVVTHGYEGTHPDHDGIAFGVQTACTLLESDGLKTPVRIEAAGYSDWGGEGIIGEFFTPSFTEGAKVHLSRERRRLKQCMVERMPTRLKILRNTPLNTESFRIAPHYDFSEPPQEGVLHYEKSGDELNGRRWRRLAEEALRALGLAIG